jgi:hypothetical protein
MAKQKTKAVVTRYRRLAMNPFSSKAITLQEAVSEAMQSVVAGQKLKDNYVLRGCNDLSHTTDTFVLADPKIEDQFFFGELVRFEQGANIPLCWGNSANPGALVIGQQVPGEGREALLGVLQFMIIGNDVVLIESGGLRTGRLEEYLTWLLKERAGSISDGTHIILETEFEISTLGGATISDVREVSLRPISLKDGEGRPIQEGVEHRDARDTTGVDVARQILDLMGNTEADIDKLIGEVPPDGDVQLRLSLLFKKGRGKDAMQPTTASARQMFRNMDDDAIELKGRDGKTVGRMTALFRETSVRLTGSIIDMKDAARVLWESYEFWVAKGKIGHAT